MLGNVQKLQGQSECRSGVSSAKGTGVAAVQCCPYRQLRRANIDLERPSGWRILPKRKLSGEKFTELGRENLAVSNSLDER
jgi:hypothetical protein